MESTNERAESPRHAWVTCKAIVVVVVMGAAAGAVCAIWMSAGVAVAAGNAEAGRVLFSDKACTGCHLPRGTPAAGPALEELRRPQGEMELAGRLWNHVPEMFAALAQRRAEWPRITVPEMADLMAYLQADAARVQSG